MTESFSFYFKFKMHFGDIIFYFNVRKTKQASEILSKVYMDNVVKERRCLK